MMHFENRTNGFSLNELLVVIAIIALLIGIAVPTSKVLHESFASSEGTVMIVGAALSNARAIASSNPENEPAGIRFQQDAMGNQYMIFVICDSDAPPNGTGLANGFRVVQGRKPIKLPANAGVTDLRIRTNLGDARDPSDEPVISDDEIDEEWELDDTTTFSIVFSKEGRLVIRDVRVRNRHGRATGNNTSNDDVFNTDENVNNNGVGMFYQDDYPADGFGQEPSRNSFVIYDKKILAEVNPASRFSDYLQNLKVLYVNRYTGDLVK